MQWQATEISKDAKAKGKRLCSRCTGCSTVRRAFLGAVVELGTYCDDGVVTDGRILRCLARPSRARSGVRIPTVLAEEGSAALRRTCGDSSMACAGAVESSASGNGGTTFVAQSSWFTAGSDESIGGVMDRVGFMACVGAQTPFFVPPSFLVVPVWPMDVGDTARMADRSETMEVVMSDLSAHHIDQNNMASDVHEGYSEGERDEYSNEETCREDEKEQQG